MPIHDWTRVTAGTFHDFHVGWIAELRRVLNRELLPKGFYAQAEQVAGDYVPDLLTLQGSARLPVQTGGDDGVVAVMTKLPQAKFEAIDQATVAAMLLASKQRYVAIRHATGNRTVALIEIVSPGNKNGQRSVETFVDKAVDSIEQGLHLVVLDVLPPGRSDPQGMHAEIWNRFNGRFAYDSSKPLTQSAYRGAPLVTSYFEQLAVGDPIPDLPLFLTQDHYVNLPLEKTYMDSFEAGPEEWRDVLEAK